MAETAWYLAVGPPPPPEAVVLQRERPADYFSRILQLPEAVLPGSARCNDADGLLEVRLTRAQTGAGEGTVTTNKARRPRTRGGLALILRDALTCG